MAASRWVFLCITLVLVVVLATMVGSMQLLPAEVWQGITGAGDATHVAVVRALRIPRALLALLVGAGLGMAGAALQGALRNALAEPYLLGVSGGAAVGAVLAVTLGWAGPFIPLAGFGGAMAAVTVTLFVAHATGARGDPRVLLMAGVVVGAFANAAIMIALANAPPTAVRGAMWWMMGSAADATLTQVAWLALYIGAGAAALLALARQVDVMALGEEPAAALGLNVDRATQRVFIAAALVAAATVAAAGLVGFVGLVVPHIVRALGARRHRPLVLGSALAGGTLVVLADVVARTAASPAELPLGAVTAVIGVPFFLAKLRRLT